MIILETTVGRKKDAYGLGVPGEIKKFVVTLLVMRHFFIVRGAPRACVDFCDPTAVSRIRVLPIHFPLFILTIHVFSTLHEWVIIRSQNH
jgi:hypothetical protein